MITDSYRIRIDALDPSGYVVAAYEQNISQTALRDNRPTRLKDFINGVVEHFLFGHRAAEKKIKPKRIRPKPLTIPDGGTLHAGHI